MEIWLSALEASELLGISKRHLHRTRAKYKSRLAKGLGGQRWDFALGSLPISAQCRYNRDIKTETTEQTEADPITDAEIYAAAPEYNRRKADKYMELIKLTDGMGRSEIESFCAEWNRVYPDCKTSYNSIAAARKAYRDSGVAALLGRLGSNAGNTKIDDQDFEYWRALYLKEGAPGAVSCWKKAFGAALLRDESLGKQSFPSYMSFLRRLERETPASAIYMARYGEAAYRRKYGYYIKRDYSDILAGEIWVSDHAQVDIAVSYMVGKDERYAFPWVSVWRDYKSGKWMGWDLHIEPPKSDHIFLSLFRAGCDYPLCSGFYLDNGKDYRHKDFTGGRRKCTVSVSQRDTIPLIQPLQIEVCWAWPYNPQSKPVERDFLRNKNDFAKHLVGYRGGNVVERPESLNSHIKARKIIPFDDFSKIFDRWVANVINREMISSGHRKGYSPDQIYEMEAPTAAKNGAIKQVSPDALKLLCTHTGPSRKIGRRGYYDSTLGVDYFDSWMIPMQGKTVYNRTDPKRCQECWIFDAENHASLGKAYLHPETPALARDDLSRSKLRDDIALLRRTNKVIRSYVKSAYRETPAEETVANHVEAVRVLNKARGYEPAEIEINAPRLATEMDRAITREGKRATSGTDDFCLEKYTPQTNHDELENFDFWKVAL